MILQSTRHRQLWLALLVVGSVALSLGFACATPFAAFAALAALTLPRNEALWAAVGVWFANQVAGFLFLRYPWTADTFAWGAALGFGMVVAVLAARTGAAQLEHAGNIAAGLGGFFAAFLAHQLFLLAVASALLGGTEDFTPTIVARIFAVNAATFAGLAVLGALALRAGLATAAPRRLALDA